MDEANLTELTQDQRFKCNLASGIILFFCGLVLFLMGVGVIPLSVKAAALPVILLHLGIILVVTALIQHNSVAMWLAFFFIVPALVVTLAKCTPLNYSNLYPIFILTPAISSLFAMLISKEFKFHLKVAAFFLVSSLVFCLESFGVLGWESVIPVIVILLGISITLGAVIMNTKSRE